jgi:hypothetical protein
MKDPAFLFYPSDFFTGTFLMSDSQLGKYIRLLCLQHINGGVLTEESMLKICGEHDPEIWAKFYKDEEGNFFNERLRHEIEKRKAYTESRRKNASVKKKGDAYDEAYVKHMGNRNRNVNKKENKSKEEEMKKKFKPPLLNEVEEYFTEKGYTIEAARRAFEYYSVNNWVDGKGNEVKNWKQKMIAVWFREENKQPKEKYKRLDLPNKEEADKIIKAAKLEIKTV